MVKADPPNMHNSGFRELPLDDLVKMVEGAIASGKGNFTFGYEGASLVIEGTSCDVRCRSDHFSLKQAATFASQLALIVQFGRKLFDEMR